ncbi:MAG: hypothetical protein J1D88_09595 [Treponema sp.]|nr:hypothetical protein [Treponema sp.]
MRKQAAQEKRQFPNIRAALSAKRAALPGKRELADVPRGQGKVKPRVRPCEGRIREIHNAGLNVVAAIHRHGMD